MTKTEWYPAEVRPVRTGYYEVECSWLCYAHYWTGAEWRVDRLAASDTAPQPWRGLTKEEEK